MRVPGYKKASPVIVIVMMIVMTAVLAAVQVLVKGKPVESEPMSYLRGSWLASSDTTQDGNEYFSSGKTIYTLTMSRTITEAMEGNVISFRVNDSYVDAYLSDDRDIDGAEKIYHFGEKLRIGDSPGTYTHFISIPETDMKYIVITISTVYKNKFLTYYDTAIGSENELIHNLLSEELAPALKNAAMMLFGILLIVIYLVSRAKRIPVTEALSLGSLSIFFAIYSNCPLFVNQYIIQNAVTQYYLNYFALYLLPLAAIIYFEDIVPGLNMKWLFWGFIALEIALCVLHITGVASFTRTIKIFSGSLGVFAVISIIMIARRYKGMTPLNRAALMMLLIFVLINVLVFIFVSTLGNQSFIASAGFLVYLIIAIVSGLKKLMDGMNQVREAELLHEIAYTDNLTKLGNRYSLERDTKRHPLEDISIVSMDLNYLKYTNDNYGHDGGDVLLRAAARCMSSVCGSVYRVGGDEFIALICGADKEKLNGLCQGLYDKVREMNTDRSDFGEYAEKEDFRLGIAAGYSSYQPGDLSYEEIMKRADEAMYQEKKKMHAQE
ncbi:MAG: GGDEF domain-containing protein [Ruminococcus sp.]|nr:GGDEF domain-containing protein [Ruminococcus sp.]